MFRAQPTPVTYIPARSSAGLATTLTVRSWSVLAVVAGLLVFHQLLLQPVLSRLDTDAPVINLAGRQRMLSQKLAKAALALQFPRQPGENRPQRAELATVADDWSRAHHALQFGAPQLQIPGNSDSTIRAAYQELEPHFQSIQEATKVLLAEPDSGTELSTAQRLAIHTILDHEAPFLGQMDRLVALHAASSKSRVALLQALGWGIVATIFALLLAIQLMVIRPAVNAVGDRLTLRETQYRRLVESMSEGLTVHDAQGRIQLANRRFCDLVGMRMDDVLGQQTTQFIATSDRARYDELLANPLLHAAPVELMLRQASGAAINVMVSIQGLPDDNLAREVFLVVVTDITSLKQAQNKSRELTEQLAHANRLKSMGELAAGLAHELNQPLAAIANYAEGGLVNLRTGQASAENLQVPLQRILSAALRGGEIVRRARRFSQRAVHETQPESLNDLIREVELLYRHEALLHEMKIELQLAAELPLIQLDGLQIQQVVANLLQNAFLAMEPIPAKDRRLCISTELISTEMGTPGTSKPDFVRVSLCDSGIGLDNVDVSRLFEPFYTTHSEGLGLGLAIAQSIVAAHGGTLEATNNCSSQEGATFRFTLALNHAVTDSTCSINEDRIAHV